MYARCTLPRNTTIAAHAPIRIREIIVRLLAALHATAKVLTFSHLAKTIWLDMLCQKISKRKSEGSKFTESGSSKGFSQLLARVACRMPPPFAEELCNPVLPSNYFCFSATRSRVVDGRPSPKVISQDSRIEIRRPTSLCVKITFSG